MSKTAIVTGASGGIGSAICQSLSNSGYKLIMQYNEHEIDFTDKIGTDFVCIKANFELEDEIINFAKDALSFSNDVDLLVNNAGISHVELFQLVSSEQAQKIMSINLNSAMLLTQKILPSMISRQTGKIINISSMWGVSGGSMEVHYSAAKAGLIGFTKSLAREVGLSGITVNCIAPGLISTQMNACFTQDEIQEVIDETPLNRIGTPEDVANLVEFLASDKAGFITSQVIGVDGGY